MINSRATSALSKVSISKLVNFLAITLVGLMFISKVGLKWTQIIPYSLPPIIYQYGLHPYINFGIQALAFAILFFIWFRRKGRGSLTVPYSVFLYSLSAVLIIQTSFQIILVHPNQSTSFQLAGLGMALMLMFLYGVIIPTLFPIEELVNWIKRFSVPLVLVSMLLLPVFWPYFFRGGRFTGVFKHIPHMVSAATFAFIFFLPDIFKSSKTNFLKSKLPKILISLTLFVAVLLTSTKAAFVTILITIIFSILFFAGSSRANKLFKFFFISSAALTITLVGLPISKVFYDVATGQTSFGMRKAQNGIETRFEEVTRGLQIFEQEPLFGKGLMFKFMNSSESVDVSGYNSFRDPHNLFVSAAVIGGYPLMILSIIGFIMMFFGSYRGLNSKNQDYQIMAIFLISHIPVFIIYHAHFSLGGMGDRMYWLVFGYLAKREIN
jgi:O-antigen ligase